MIEIHDLYKSFGEQEVLKGIDLRLKSNENLVILGRSGTGKSVLIKCLVGLEKFDRGSVQVLGQEIASLNEFELNDLRTKIGFLFQGGALYDSMSVEENILFPLDRIARHLTRAEKDNLVDEVLDRVNLLDAKKKMPSELSGGMQKRAGLARTLVLKPKVILYDEPTTGLDPFTSEGINDLILSIKERYKTTSIVVTHDMYSARKVADRIIIMDQGEILARGTFDELRKIDHPVIKGFFNQKETKDYAAKK
ncbi:MAG: ATP-binding cassette domain-containing protein [Bacteroidales bacterium]|nr:ATP-binding cassette domain-containing protein [Bacteroidales bacterium]